MAQNYVGIFAPRFHIEPTSLPSIFFFHQNHLPVPLIRGKPVIKSAINFTRLIFVSSHSPFRFCYPPSRAPPFSFALSFFFNRELDCITNNWIPFHQRRTKFNFSRLGGRAEIFQPAANSRKKRKKERSGGTGAWRDVREGPLLRVRRRKIGKCIIARGRGEGGGGGDLKKYATRRWNKEKKSRKLSESILRDAHAIHWLRGADRAFEYTLDWVTPIPNGNNCLPPTGLNNLGLGPSRLQISIRLQNVCSFIL